MKGPKKRSSLSFPIWLTVLPRRERTSPKIVEASVIERKTLRFPLEKWSGTSDEKTNDHLTRYPGSGYIYTAHKRALIVASIRV